MWATDGGEGTGKTLSHASCVPCLPPCVTPQIISSFSDSQQGLMMSPLECDHTWLSKSLNPTGLHVFFIHEVGISRCPGLGGQNESYV